MKQNSTLKLTSLLIFLLIAFATQAQVIVTNVENIYGGRINTIAKAPISGTTDSFYVYITTESANTAFYAKAKVNATSTPTISAFAKVPGLDAAAAYGSGINKIAAHSASGLLYFITNGKVYTANSTTSAVTVFRTFGVDTSINDITIKDNRLFFYLRINGGTPNDMLAASDLDASGKATNFTNIANYNTSIVLPQKDKISYINTDSIIIFKEGTDPSLTLVSNVDDVFPTKTLTHDDLSTLSTSVFWKCAAIAPDGTLFIGGSDNSNKYVAYKSTIATTWTVVNTGIAGTSGPNIDFFANTASNYYVYFGSAYSNAKGVAASWTNFGNVSLETHSNDGSIVTLGAGVGGGTALLTTDQGLGWTKNSGSILTEVDNGIEAVQVNDFDMRTQQDTGWLASKAGIRYVYNYKSGTKTWSSPMFPNGDGSPYYSCEMIGNNGKQAFVGNVRVYRTKDFGSNWTRVFTAENAPYSFPSNVQVTSLAVSADYPNIVLAGYKNPESNKRGGVFCSVDTGNTWNQLLCYATTTGQDVDVNDIEIISDSGKVVAYIGVDYDSTVSPVITGMYKAQYDGATWSVRKEVIYAPSTSLLRITDIEIVSKDTIAAVGGFYNPVSKYEYPISLTISRPKYNNWTSSVVPYRNTYYSAATWKTDTLFYSYRDSIYYQQHSFGTTGTTVATEKLYTSIAKGTEINVLYYDDLLGGSSTGFYGFKNTTILPLNITVFTAIANKESNLINWVNETDEEVASYNVEAACDGVNFEQVTSVVSDGRKSYNYSHNSACKDATYYRLKAINKQGTIEYSKIVKVGNTGNVSFKIYPNPVTSGKLLIESSITGTIVSRVFDMTGKERYYSNNNTSGLITVDVSHLPTGNYVLQLTNGSTTKSTVIMVK